MKSSYPSDLSDEEWKIIASMLPPAKPGRRPRTTDMKQLCNKIYYHLKTGCQWEYLRPNFPPASTVYSYYRRWQKKGIWETINHKMRELVREKENKFRQSTVALADSQSVKTTEKAVRPRCGFRRIANPKGLASHRAHQDRGKYLVSTAARK